jgi:hypothetical protein
MSSRNPAKEQMAISALTHQGWRARTANSELRGSCHFIAGF